MKIKKGFEKTLFIAGLIFLCLTLLREPNDTKVQRDNISYLLFTLTLSCFFISFWGRKTLEFFRSYKNSTPEATEDPTIDSFRNDEEWKEFVSDGCH